MRIPIADGATHLRGVVKSPWFPIAKGRRTFPWRLNQIRI